MKKLSRIALLLCALGLLLLSAGCGDDSSSHRAAAEADDSVALAGVSEGKGIFDINMGDAQKLPLYFSVIQQTYEGLEDQGVAPDFVLAFRGMAVTLITDDADEAIKAAITELAALPNVRMEACAIATNLFGVDNETVLPEITVVGNTFISAIGYQAKGYAPILIQ